MVWAPTVEARDTAKNTLLHNCKNLQIHSVLICPKFLDILIDMDVIPCLHSSTLLCDVQNSFIHWGSKDGKPSIVARVCSVVCQPLDLSNLWILQMLIHMFSIMQQKMMQMLTKHVVAGCEDADSPTCVPKLLSGALLANIDIIYNNTMGLVISQDGIFTPAFTGAWRDYWQDVANYFFQVFGDTNNIDYASTAYGRAGLHMHLNVLHLMPSAETLSESSISLPWPILTDGVMKDFTEAALSL
jgi:hypothetical protein